LGPAADSDSALDQENIPDTDGQQQQQQQLVDPAVAGSVGPSTRKQGFTPSRLACISALRDELSCGICLDICVRPCATPCGAFSLPTWPGMCAQAYSTLGAHGCICVQALLHLRTIASAASLHHRVRARPPEPSYASLLQCTTQQPAFVDSKAQLDTSWQLHGHISMALLTAALRALR
jgi:hypothetical protein